MGPATVYEPTTAQTFGKLYQPDRTKRQQQGKMGTEWPMSAGNEVGPAVLINKFGQGIVVTCAASPDYAAASEYSLVEDRILFRNLFRALHPPRRVRIAAPSNVESIVTDDRSSQTLRIHFLAYHPTPRTTPPKNRPYVLPGMIEDKPIFRVSVVTTEPFQKVEALHPQTSILTRQNRIEATIEDIHEVLIVHY